GAVGAVGRTLSRSILRRDRLQGSNLRLIALRRRVRELSDRLRDVARPVGPFGEADLINPRRESYRAYLQQSAPLRSPTPHTVSDGVRRLRYEPRWTAEVPGI